MNIKKYITKSNTSNKKLLDYCESLNVTHTIVSIYAKGAKFYATLENIYYEDLVNGNVNDVYRRRPDIFWLTADEKLVLIRDMTDSHLTNCINKFEGRPTRFSEDSLRAMRAEVMRRFGKRSSDQEQLAPPSINDF